MLKEHINNENMTIIVKCAVLMARSMGCYLAVKIYVPPLIPYMQNIVVPPPLWQFNNYIMCWIYRILTVAIVDP